MRNHAGAVTVAQAEPVARTGPRPVQGVTADRSPHRRPFFVSARCRASDWGNASRHARRWTSPRTPRPVRMGWVRHDSWSAHQLPEHRDRHERCAVLYSVRKRPPCHQPTDHADCSCNHRNRLLYIAKDTEPVNSEDHYADMRVIAIVTGLSREIGFSR